MKANHVFISFSKALLIIPVSGQPLEMNGEHLALGDLEDLIISHP